jgi:hypothetical protein
MPDYTVKADVDSMLRADNDAGIRSAIGLGQTDAPTFLNFTATGTVSSAPRFAVTSDFLIVPNNSGVGLAFNGGPLLGGTSTTDSVQLRNNGGTAAARLAVDANEILAQRNGTAKQTLRIYNTYTSATVYERAVMDWNGPTPGNLQIGTEFLGSGSGMAARPIDFVLGGVVQLSITTGGTLVSPTSSIRLRGAFTEIQGTNGATGAYLNFIQRGRITPTADGVFKLSNDTDNGFTRLELGTANLGISRGTGTPEGVVTALVGSLYIRTDGGASTTLYVKESGTGNTGWVAK